MPVPDYQSLMLPLLLFASDNQQHHIREAIAALANELKLSESERDELLPNGKKFKFDDRVQWANTYLKKARLLESTGRGVFCITERGQETLQQNPRYIDRKYLMQYPEFVEFISPVQTQPRQEVPSNEQIRVEQTPQEMIYPIRQSLNLKLAEELLDYIISSSPQFFEQLVVDLLLAMGYGGLRKDAGQAIGGTGDGGIDGVIKEDKLGLDVIYIQAKNWNRDAGISRPEVQKFVGSLMGKGATKGVFITTSYFTKEAIEYAKHILNAKVILIDGQQLTQLMIENNVGVTVEDTVIIKKVDKDYFLE